MRAELKDPVGYPDFTRPVSIIGYTITSLPIDIVAQTIAKLEIDIVAQTLARLNVNIAASAVMLDINIAASAVTLDVNIAASAVTLDINIAAQAVDINIKTATGVNIVIDQLTQTAYTERRSTLSNNGITPSWTFAIGDNRHGKFFPRGCRGFIDTIDVYCKDAGTAGGTITVYISPHPSMGYLASATITVPAAAAPAWRSADFNIMWNYDSLFIFALSSASEMQFGYDEGTPFDNYWSTDAAATWISQDLRVWFRAVYKGQTVGDLPISGTINTIQIPTLVARRVSGIKTVPAGEEILLESIEGVGELMYMFWRVDHDWVFIRIYCDGDLKEDICPNTLNLWGIDKYNPIFPMGVYVSAGTCRGMIIVPYPFKRKLEVKAYNSTAVDRLAEAEFVSKLLG